jgi:hypothetical protein
MFSHTASLPTVLQASLLWPCFSTASPTPEDERQCAEVARPVGYVIAYLWYFLIHSGLLTIHDNRIYICICCNG